MRAHTLIVIAALATIATTTACSMQNQGNPQGDYGTVQGVVSSSAGPIAGAQVCIDVSVCATSGADGTYKISNVPADPAGAMEPITATATGYVPFSGQVHVTAGTTPTPFNITMTHS